jgi:hypothetical protein
MTKTGTIQATYEQYAKRLELASAFHLNTEQTPLFVDAESGDITRADHADFMPSGQWKARAIYQAGPFGRWNRFADWKAGLAKLAVMDSVRFKNGKPRFFLGDCDHGADRIMGAGIRDVRGPFRYVRDDKGRWESPA